MVDVATFDLYESGEYHDDILLVAGENCTFTSAYRIDGDTIRVRQNYLLPPAELNLIRLYSWPDNFGNVTSPFNRIMNRDVFEMIKAILSLQGYQFEKE